MMDVAKGHHLLRAAFCAGVAALCAFPALSEPLRCDLASYHAADGLRATLADDVLTIRWQSEANDRQAQIRFAIDGGMPILRDISLQAVDDRWQTVVRDARPGFSIVTAIRRITNQQLDPLNKLGVKITPEVIEEAKWDAFWDAPLQLSPPGSPSNGGPSSPPPAEGILGQPPLPRQANEIRRATLHFTQPQCAVTSDGARLTVAFSGAELGLFRGRLQFTVFRGAGLIKQEMVAKTDAPSVAYKYDAGLSGLPIDDRSQVKWRDVSGVWTGNLLGGGRNAGPVPVQSANRLIAGEFAGGSIALFPPPHTFFWAREMSFNLGYSWYRKDDEGRFSFGIRQAEEEIAPGYSGRGTDDDRGNFALYSAPPGSEQHMILFLLPSLSAGDRAIADALQFTRDDHYKPLPGYQVMLAHDHGYFIRRQHHLNQGDDWKPLDFETIRATGANIFAPIDGGAAGTRTPPTPAEYLANLDRFYDLAVRNSDRTFAVMANTEVTEGELPKIVPMLGGHWDLLMPHPVYFTQGRAEAQPLIESDARHPKIYRLGSERDIMDMMRDEGMIAFMPHPRSKGSTGYPDAIADTDRFRSDQFRGIGWRWGMGLDLSERRLCEKRCQKTWDDMNNWMAARDAPLKHMEAISEFYEQGPGDDIYANNPVSYLRMDKLPAPGDWSGIVETMRQGDFFVTSGEVLLDQVALERTAKGASMVATIQWTFPMDFAEIVWGDGKKTGREIVSLTGEAPFGTKRLSIPFDPRGKKWVRFAAWDTAGNGAMAQPVRLDRAKR
ncbi:hypothetical protein HL653_03370 [Sphingomonas sp. AP4-R1]|uniref:hypothetical protein n=1 Tax=Sphingomonas sp. AP4-R1 TaxID=2735134 RepID=UPI00149374B0|nr:hypothetical protein [Sphingomonas sp. AP4-R1]QJU56956.1 hypothetical protein HL653_03370 [Sphingomonas sp. AP4-R1]